MYLLWKHIYFTSLEIFNINNIYNENLLLLLYDKAVNCNVQSL